MAAMSAVSTTLDPTVLSIVADLEGHDLNGLRRRRMISTTGDFRSSRAVPGFHLPGRNPPKAVAPVHSTYTQTRPRWDAIGGPLGGD
jgi:hypothetical protein